MGYLEDYIARVTAERTTARDYKIQMAKARAIRHFKEDPSALTIQALEPDGASLITKHIRVINESVLKQLNPERVYSKYIVPHPEEPMISGTLLFGIYGEDYLVTAITGLGEITQQAVLQKINETITTVIDNVVIPIPAVVTGISRLGDGVLEMNLIRMPDELVKVRVQKNSITDTIKRNTRFSIADKMYELTRIDKYTDEGVLNWILKEDLIEPSDTQPPVLPTGIDGATLISIGRNYEYTVDADITNWSLEGVTSANVELVSSDIRKCVLRVVKFEKISFTLKATTVSGVELVYPIKIVSLL